MFGFYDYFSLNHNKKQNRIQQKPLLCKYNRFSDGFFFTYYYDYYENNKKNDFNVLTRQTFLPETIKPKVDDRNKISGGKIVYKPIKKKQHSN